MAARARGRLRLCAESPLRLLPQCRHLLLAEAPDHEAHVRVTGEGGRLEHALHDERLNLTVDLEHDHARKILAGVQLLPELALVLEDVEELFAALEAVG